jgi:hypothetical protein
MKFTHACGDQPIPGYTIQRGLGRGGFGEVYQAITDGGKEVALKLVQRNLEVELRGVNQCLNLKHPHLVSLYDVKRAENGDNWVVMEYMSGESLDQYIARNAQGMAPEEALHWLRGICAGVGHLHERGIVHRDLKPSNLFIENGIIKIGDYGLTKFISTSRRSGQTESVGTVHYMAPEVAKGRYGKELDLYAIGIILYEMLTGRVPFDGESPGEILMKHLSAEPDVSIVPPPYRAVVARLLDKDPQRRYSSVEALLADLQPSARPAVAEPATVGVGAGGLPNFWQPWLRKVLSLTHAVGAGAREVVNRGYPVDRETDYPNKGSGAGAGKSGVPVYAQKSDSWPQRSTGGTAPPLCPSSIFQKVVAVVVRLLVALFVGTGAGLLTGGLVLSDNPRNIAAAGFLGPGVGVLLCAVITYLMFRSFRRALWWRGVIALLVGPGAGLVAAGLTLIDKPRAFGAAAFLGPGVGLLACGITLYLLFVRAIAKDRHSLLDGLPESQPRQTQPYKPASDQSSP